MCVHRVGIDLPVAVTSNSDRIKRHSSFTRPLTEVPLNGKSALYVECTCVRLCVHTYVVWCGVNCTHTSVRCCSVMEWMEFLNCSFTQAQNSRKFTGVCYMYVCLSVFVCVCVCLCVCVCVCVRCVTVNTLLVHKPQIHMQHTHTHTHRSLHSVQEYKVCFY